MLYQVKCLCFSPTDCMYTVLICHLSIGCIHGKELPSQVIHVFVIPLLKCETNYCPIASATSISKVLPGSFFARLQAFLPSADSQLGFKGAMERKWWYPGIQEPDHLRMLVSPTGHFIHCEHCLYLCTAEQMLSVTQVLIAQRGFRPWTFRWLYLVYISTEHGGFFCS